MASTMEQPQVFATIDELVATHVRFVIAQFEGNITASAKALGVHRRTLHRMVEKDRTLLDGLKAHPEPKRCVNVDCPSRGVVHHHGV